VAVRIEVAWIAGVLQFAVIGNNAFVITHATTDGAEVKLTSWSATRAAHSRQNHGATAGKGSMLQRWGWYLVAAILLVGYRVAKAKQA